MDGKRITDKKKPGKPPTDEFKDFMDMINRDDD
jgi:hypothetical protein